VNFHPGAKRRRIGQVSRQLIQPKVGLLDRRPVAFDTVIREQRPYDGRRLIGAQHGRRRRKEDGERRENPLHAKSLWGHQVIDFSVHQAKRCHAYRNAPVRSGQTDSPLSGVPVIERSRASPWGWHTRYLAFMVVKNYDRARP
jgi:hypothetical protein